MQAGRDGDAGGEQRSVAEFRRAWFGAGGAACREMPEAEMESQVAGLEERDAARVVGRLPFSRSPRRASAPRPRERVLDEGASDVPCDVLAPYQIMRTAGIGPSVLISAGSGDTTNSQACSRPSMAAGRPAIARSFAAARQG